MTTSPENRPDWMFPGDHFVEGYGNDADAPYLVSPIRAARYGMELLRLEQAGIRYKVPDDVNDPYYRLFGLAPTLPPRE